MNLHDAIQKSSFQLAVRAKKGAGLSYVHSYGLVWTAGDVNDKNLNMVRFGPYVNRFDDYFPVTEKEIKQEPCKSHYELIQLELETNPDIDKTPMAPSKLKKEPQKDPVILPEPQEKKNPDKVLPREGAKVVAPSPSKNGDKAPSKITLRGLFSEWYREYDTLTGLLREMDNTNFGDEGLKALIGRVEIQLDRVKNLLG